MRHLALIPCILSVPLWLSSGMTLAADTVRAEVRAELVRLDNKTEVEAKSGELGQIGVPKSGFCSYEYSGTSITIKDSTGVYTDGGPTPDGCFAPSVSETPEFVFSCLPGQTIAFRVSSSTDEKGVDLFASGFDIQGGVLEGSPPSFKLLCQAEDGQVRLSANLTITLTPDVGDLSGGLGSIDLDRDYQ